MTQQAGLPPVSDMKLELVPIPVADTDRAKEFYERIGFTNVHDNQITPEMRVVQLTPPGSSCAIVFGTGMGPINKMEPGSVKGIHLVVKDINTSRDAMIARNVEASEVQDVGGVKYVWFTDPDGNIWCLQQWPDSYKA